MQNFISFLMELIFSKNFLRAHFTIYQKCPFKGQLAGSAQSSVPGELTWLGLRNEYILGTTCNETHPAFWQLPKNKRKQRNFGGIPGFGDDPNGINPGDMWNVFETGTILLESDEGKKTTVRVDKLSQITGITDNPR